MADANQQRLIDNLRSAMEELDQYSRDVTSLKRLRDSVADANRQRLIDNLRSALAAFRLVT